MRIVRKLIIFMLALAVVLSCCACSPAASGPDSTAPSALPGNNAVGGAENTADTGSASSQNTAGQTEVSGGTADTLSPQPSAPTVSQSPVPPAISAPDNSAAPAQSPTSPAASSSPPAPPSATSDQPSAPPAPSASDPSATPSPPPSSSASPSSTPSPSASVSPAPAVPPPSPDEPVILTISGAGVGGETTWTRSSLQDLRDGYREYKYSTTNNWPVYGHVSAHGISLPYLLRQAGMQSNAAGFRLTATDGYYLTVTYEQVFGPRYAYSNHSGAGSGGASVVEPVIAWEWGEEGKVRPENIRAFFGHSGPYEVNTSAFVQNLCTIEVLTVSPGAWAAPGSSIADGSVVSFGTELSLIHDYMDSLRIYYTLDGSTPDYNSLVYNRSTSYFQPHLIVPLLLTESVTVRAFAAGYGKDPSPVVTFSITVE